MNSDMPEIITTHQPEVTVKIGAETRPDSELLHTTPVQVTQTMSNDEDSSGPAIIAPKDPDELPDEEVADMVSPEIKEVDVDWTERVKDVMTEDAGKPYKEDLDASKLNEEYMKSRFNVDIDAPVEEK